MKARDRGERRTIPVLVFVEQYEPFLCAPEFAEVADDGEVARVLAGMPVRLAEILRLHHLEDRAFAECGRLMGIASSTAALYGYLARKRFRVDHERLFGRAA